MDLDSLRAPEARDETFYAANRIPGRTYFSDPRPLTFGHTDERGQPARYVKRVSDETTLTAACPTDCNCEKITVTQSPAGRVQYVAHVVRDAGWVRKIEIQKYKKRSGKLELEHCLNLEDQQARDLVQWAKIVAVTPADGDGGGRIDESLIDLAMSNPNALDYVYRQDPAALAELIETNTNATDVLAIASRRAAAQKFEDMLSDEDAFETIRAARKPESTWQTFFEENPWILGANLASQLFLSWDPKKLESTVAGANIISPGKRIDALLTTAGRFKSFVFAEIKQHTAALLDPTEYRSGTYAPSREVVGGVAQLQQTLLYARAQLGEEVRRILPDGSEEHDPTMMLEPRGYLIIGQLNEFEGAGGVKPHHFRSFEAYRRGLRDIEIITYDELLAAAKSKVHLLEQNSGLIQ